MVKLSDPYQGLGTVGQEHLLPTLASDCQEEGSGGGGDLACMLLLTQGPREHP